VQQSQRDYYLREQLKAIQKELGEMDEGQKDIEELRQKIETPACRRRRRKRR
jgi:ATP-dependent Lon protease